MMLAVFVVAYVAGGVLAFFLGWAVCQKMHCKAAGVVCDRGIGGESLTAPGVLGEWVEACGKIPTWKEIR